MTGDRFRTLIEQIWPAHGSQTRAAEYLEVNSSRIREWIRGARPVPDGVAAEIQSLAEQFPGGIRDVDPRRTIAILHQQMLAAGWTAAESAAGILGAAAYNARLHISEDDIQVMMRGRE
ncbi:hypothetical protein [Pontibaca methylaminivorans]|uniref:Uncharacterized protein n=1 Tax=Pontibaca methylaminivorans TaxID=515897 RepID=A0A1R3WAL1_9RHOB|nr:hypothetical protein [Pontibaca methylaminivorans]SIT74842.1 hypothetical protein SAMN05421849_0221 [Pontibaca methylaminivorans]